MVGVNQDGTIDLGFGGMVLNPASGKVSFNVGGTRTPVGNNFKARGTIAPRRGTADAMSRTVSTETPYVPNQGGYSTIGEKVTGEILFPTGRPSVSEFGDDILSGWDTKPKSGDGGDNAYTKAIKILQQRLSGGGYGTGFDELSTLLGTTSGTARGQIDQATADAIARISAPDALGTPINYSAGTAQIPQTALNNYLNAIGASTGTVDAGRNFLQGLIDTSASTNAQAQAAQAQAQQAQQQAALAALTGNQQFQQGNLSTATQAQQMAISAAKAKERKALEDQILEYVLKGGRA